MHLSNLFSMQKYELPAEYSCTVDRNGTVSAAASLDVPVPCMFETGSDVIAFYSMDEDNYAIDIIALFIFMIVLRVGGLLALHAKAYRRRG